jgi:hypothetical protein
MTIPSTNDDILFEVDTPLGYRVRTTISYWALITTVKHPAIRGREQDVQTTLRHPDEIRISKTDGQIYLFYRADGYNRWMCAVTKRLNGVGFLVTVYRTGRIKEGNRIWPT